MVGQRRGQPRRGRGGHRARLGGLALALSLCLIALPGCGGGPTGIPEPDGNGGVSGGSSPVQRLVGTWRTTVVVEVPGDIQTWTTTWRFDADGECLQTVETESLAEGFPRVTQRPCTFQVADFEITFAFSGAGTVVFEYSFADFSPDRLVLDGFEYQRIA